jgi:Ice-binding-like
MLNPPHNSFKHKGEIMNTHTASIVLSQQFLAVDADANSWFSSNYPGLLASLGFVALFSLVQSGAALAATKPSLGSTSTYGVVSSTFTNSNTAPQTIVNGDVCFTTGPVTPPLTITGVTTTPCPPATGVDQGLALANLIGQPCTSLGAGAVALDSVVVGTNPPGVIPPGCYSSGGAMDVTLSTTVTLDGAGVYIFRPGGALNTGDNSSVILADGACASDVFWAPVGATTLGANAALSLTPTFVGNILDAAGITIGHFANLTGRALAFGGTVTTDADTITVPSCATKARNVGIVPTLSEWMTAMLAALLAIAGFAAMRRSAR